MWTRDLFWARPGDAFVLDLLTLKPAPSGGRHKRHLPPQPGTGHSQPAQSKLQFVANKMELSSVRPVGGPFA